MILQDIIELYDNHMARQNEKNRQTRYVGKETWFHASGAGGCHLKHLLASCGIEGTEQGKSINTRVMRLGTIVHEDIQAALIPVDWKVHTEIRNEAGQITYTGDELLVEDEITLPMWNVRGFYDIANINHKDKIIQVFDIKTAAAYKFSIIFGRKPDTMPSNMYDLQLSTYALGLAQQFPDYELQMYLLYYKKDNSDFRVKTVGTENLIHASNYWTAVNEFVDANKEIVLRLNAECKIIAEKDGNPYMAFEHFKTGIRQFCNPGQQLNLPCVGFECNPLYCNKAVLCPSRLHISKKRK